MDSSVAGTITLGDVASGVLTVRSFNAGLLNITNNSTTQSLGMIVALQGNNYNLTFSDAGEALLLMRSDRPRFLSSMGEAIQPLLLTMGHRHVQ